MTKPMLSNASRYTRPPLIEYSCRESQCAVMASASAWHRLVVPIREACSRPMRAEIMPVSATAMFAGAAKRNLTKLRNRVTKWYRCAPKSFPQRVWCANRNTCRPRRLDAPGACIRTSPNTAQWAANKFGGVWKLYGEQERSFSRDAASCGHVWMHHLRSLRCPCGKNFLREI